MIYLLALLAIFEFVGMFQKRQLTPQFALILIGAGIVMSTTNQYVQAVGIGVVLTSGLRFFMILKGNGNA